MKDTEFNELHEFVFAGAGWEPSNQNAQDLMERSSEGEVQVFREVTGRDMAFHRCYFSLLNYIWSYMPDNFKSEVPVGVFYKWLKHLRGEYDVVFEYGDGTKLIEYQSVSFGRMSQMQFETYVREQLPFIYESVIGSMYEGYQYDSILENIEEEFKKFLSKL